MSIWKLATYTLAAVFFTFSVPNSADAAITDSATGQSFPDTVTVSVDGKDTTLTGTGVSTRKKFFVKVYSVAHYMQDPKGSGNDLFDEILNSDKPKQLFLKWVRSASGKKVQDGYKESFDKVVSRGQSNVQSDVDKYIGFFSKGVTEGNTHQMNWLPDGTIEVYINGNQVGSIKNKDFAKALWEIWFGRKSVVNRNQLVSRVR